MCACVFAHTYVLWSCYECLHAANIKNSLRYKEKLSQNATESIAEEHYFPLKVAQSVRPFKYIHCILHTCIHCGTKKCSQL